MAVHAYCHIHVSNHAVVGRPDTTVGHSLTCNFDTTNPVAVAAVETCSKVVIDMIGMKSNRYWNFHRLNSQRFQIASAVEILTIGFGYYY